LLEDDEIKSEAEFLKAVKVLYDQVNVGSDKTGRLSKLYRR